LFLGAALAAPALGVIPARAEENAKPIRKLKLGLIGCGGRGQWLADLFLKHGGYDLHAVADYFPNVAEQAGEKLQVAKARRFSGLDGYKRVIASGVEAVVVIDVPYFYPEQARAAIEAGKHVYMAKPIAVDVPGTLLVSETGKLATKKQLCLLVDYQLPTDPAVIELGKRVNAGALGRLGHIASFGMGWHAWPDPPLGKTIEGRLRDQIWLSDTGLSGDTIVSYDIHIIDGLMWLLGRRPTAACGRARTYRPQPHGDRTDIATVLFEFDDGLLWTHVTQALDNSFDVTTLSASVFGDAATAHLQYSGKIYIRGGKQTYAGQIGSIYNKGAERNIATFHRSICEGHFENASVPRAVDGHLTAILGREAAARRKFLTLDELIKENKKLTVDLSGLKV
jgi:predicted dehydrogenase